MEYRRVGRSGLKVSVFGLGGWLTFGESVKDKKIINRIIKTAYEKGINYFDIADVYALGEAEKLMGEVLREYPRHRLVIASKVFWPMSDDINDRGLSRKHIFESIDKSLKRIGTDYIDIYYCHRFDPEVPLEETLKAMSDLVHQGKILYWGTSMWSHAQILEAMMLCERYGLYKPIVEQPVYNLIIREHFEKEVKPSIEKFGIGAIVFSPLLSGILTGKYDEGIPPGSRL
ncbi:MAG: aldo/keto reductase, partial [Candidatus Marinimicrobia bacterium]|nr:aldo/keto reductase [Candidatus Neomarinimicrobiota bacterium]